METTAKLFTNGRSQAVRLPAAFRFEAGEVYVRRDAATGDVILSRRPATWDGFFAAAQAARAELPPVRQDEAPRGDPFEGWAE